MLGHLGVVLLDRVRVVLDGHGGDVGLALEDLHGHLAGGAAELVVVDGQRRNAAALADALLAGDDGLRGSALDGLGAGGGGVVGRDVEDVVGVTRRAGDGDDIVRIREGVDGDGAAGLFKRGLDDVRLVDGVRLAGAVDDRAAQGRTCRRCCRRPCRRSCRCRAQRRTP